MLGGHRKGMRARGVPDDQVGIGAHGQRALARVKPEQFGRRLAHHLHQPRQANLAAIHAGVVHHREHGLDLRRTIRGLEEVVGRFLGLRRVITANRHQCTIGQALPQRLVVGWGAQRRSDFGQRPHPGGGLLSQSQILGAGLAVDLPATGLRPAQRLQARGRTVVRHVQRTTHHLRQRHGPVQRLGLQEIRPHSGERLDRGAPLAQEFILQVIGRQAILGVDRYQPALAGHHVHQGRQPVVVGHPLQLGVGHEDLERGDAQFKGCRHVGQLIFHIEQPAVQTKIQYGMRQSIVPELLQGLDQFHSRLGISVMDHSRHATMGRRHRYAAQVVQVDRMGVNVYHARQHELAGRVDHPPGAPQVQIRCDLCDLLALDAQVNTRYPAARHHQPTLDDQIQTITHQSTFSSAAINLAFCSCVPTETRKEPGKS